MSELSPQMAAPLAVIQANACKPGREGAAGGPITGGGSEAFIGAMMPAWRLGPLSSAFKNRDLHLENAHASSD
jgi:hypothetical protein